MSSMTIQLCLTLQSETLWKQSVNEEEMGCCWTVGHTGRRRYQAWNID